MTVTDTPTVTIRNAEDILAIVPHMIGFTPGVGSLVILNVGPERGPSARLDLPELADMPQLVRALMPALPQISRAILVAYTHDAELAHAAFDQISEHVEVLTVIRVSDGFYWEREAEGLPYDDASENQASVEMIGHGSAPAASREDYAVASEPELEMVALVTALTGVLPAGLLCTARVRADQLWAYERCSRFTEPLDNADAARLTVALCRKEVRDAVVATLRCDQHAKARTAFWRHAASKCSTLQTTVAALYAMAAWLAGNGAEAWFGCEFITDHHGDTSLSSLIEIALSGAMDPALWPTLDIADVLVKEDA